MVEVYNECVYDLLVPPSEGHEKLQIQKKGKDVVVPVSDLPSECCVYHVYILISLDGTQAPRFSA